MKEIKSSWVKTKKAKNSNEVKSNLKFIIKKYKKL